MAPESDKTYTVTWDSTRKGAPKVGRIEVDGLTLVKGEPQAGFTEDQVRRLEESFKGKYTFSVEEGDTTEKEEKKSSLKSVGSQTGSTSAKGGSQSKTPTTPPAPGGGS